MQTIWNAVARFFGGAHNEEVQAKLSALVATAAECAKHLRATSGNDLQRIVELEHQGDRLLDEIHELLDGSFIMRFDIPDLMKLADQFDDVIDGMRTVATHLDNYKRFLTNPRPEAGQLKQLIADMLAILQGLVAMMGERRMSLAKVREGVKALDEKEAEADRLLAAAERRLIEEYSPAGANRLEFIAIDKLYQLLEETTDCAKHCGKLILSLARKEA